ncbi:MAG: fibronectin type III domain-containing protein [Deltaproteobacteria bacterium]|nr:fibronectin type III domain-containing protein [Deltaproteobacteria bacterium]
MAPAFRFGTITEAQQYEELRRAYPRLHAAIERAFPPIQPPRPELFLRDSSLAADLAQATARWPRLLAELVKRGGSPAASTAIPSGRLTAGPAAPPLALTAPAAALAPFLKSHDSFALKFRNAGESKADYLVATRTEWDWSKMPRVQWQLLLENGAKGDPIAAGKGVALQNSWGFKEGKPLRYLVPEAKAGSNRPRWTDKWEAANFCWFVHGEPPYIQLTLGPNPGQQALIYDPDADELVIGSAPVYADTATIATDPNLVTVRRPAAAERISMMPCFGDFLPGEGTYVPDRPETWAIYCPSPGSGKDPYPTIIRSPFLQDVAPTSAVLRWRIAVPEGIQPQLFFQVKYAPAGVDLDGASFTDVGGKVVTMDSVPKPEVVHCDEYSEYGGSPPYPLVRPARDFRVRFEGLTPATTYHYRVVCSCWDASAFLSGATANPKPAPVVLADDVTFRTAPAQFSTTEAVTFVVVGDLGKGVGRPDYIYDVFDLMHRVARDAGASLWLLPGDVDNVGQGDPDRLDPYLFSLFNAYHNRQDPGGSVGSSPYGTETTSSLAFRQPPYLGLLGGLAVYPVAGNHDVGMCYSDGGNWSKCRPSFELPPESTGGL